MILAGHKGNNIVGHMIEYGTHSIYSHVETIFKDGKSFSARAELTPAVNIIPFDGSDKLWNFYDLTSVISTTQEDNVLRPWAETQCGKSYDWAADIGFPLPFVKDNTHKLMCSGSNTLLFQQIGWFPTFVPAQVSPGQLITMVQVMLEARKLF